MEIAIAALVGACLLVAAFYGLRGSAAARARSAAANRAAELAGTPLSRRRTCPLCSSVLGPGERVKSSLYPGKADRIMHIFGCAHCWPTQPAIRVTQAAPRICPVCGNELDREGWVVARYFERPSRAGLAAKGHIHVLGCTGCRS
jgi:hypothetical protein